MTVPLSCQAGARCVGTVRVRSFAPVRVGRTRKVISVTRKVSYNLAGGKKRTVRLALSRDAKTAMKKSKRLAVRVVIDPKPGRIVSKRTTLIRK